MMDTLPNSPEARDIEYLFHPYTNARLHQKDGPLVLERGEGVHVFDSAGNRYIEALAGLWSVAVGFSEDRLVQAAAQQMQKLPYYHSFAHKSHNPAIDLAEKLVQMAPVPMSKVFFTNSGSEANDTVIKLLWYRSNAMGEPQRKKIISRLRGYHGVTIAYANYCGTEGDLTYVGGSLIVGPHGEVLAQAGQFPALLIADIPPRDTSRLSTQSRDLRKV